MDENYIQNGPVKAPGLVIKAGSSAVVKAGNAFALKAQGFLSVNIAANQDMALLSAATGPFGVATGNLADGYSRVYTFFGSVNKDTGAVAYSVEHGADFLTAARPAQVGTDFNFGNVTVDSANVVQQTSKKAIIGFLIVSTSGAAFIPGTTALDAGTVTARYFDHAVFIGK